VQAYLSDLMHVTVLAVKITEQQASRQVDTKTTSLMDVQVQQSEESEPTTPKIAPKEVKQAAPAAKATKTKTEKVVV